MTTATATAAQTLPELFVATVRRRRHQPALGIIEGGKLTWHTWEDLGAAVEVRVRELTQRGILRGDLVVQIGPNSVEWVVNDMALHYIGAVHVPLHTTLSKSKQKELIAHCGAEHVIELGKDCNKIKLGRRSSERIGKDIPPHSICGPQSLATILYTSGTTGEPRGVMLTQENLVSNTVALSEAVGSRNELRLVLLPFSHIYARTCDLYSWIHRGSQLILAENPRETFMRDCQLVKPNVINAVPYLYQKLVDLADAEVERAAAEGEGATPPKTIRQLLGGHIARCYCGGAALAPPVVERFAEERLALLPGYGLTEASPVVTVPSHTEFSPTTVGRPLSNIEVRLAEADGEILVRGPSVMKGYWLNETATDEVLKDGWLHTGDLGEWDAEGRLSIVGRKKELMALATGKKILPSALETLICASPWIEQAIVIGEGRRYLSAIIVPNPKRIKGEIRKQKLFVWSKKRGVSHPKIRKIIQREINATLAHLPAQQQVKKFTIIDRGFSIDLGEMTPKLSLRRKTIEKNFAKEIEAMYG